MQWETATPVGLPADAAKDSSVKTEAEMNQQVVFHTLPEREGDDIQTLVSLPPFSSIWTLRPMMGVRCCLYVAPVGPPLGPHRQGLHHFRLGGPLHRLGVRRHL